jgi:serine/alanine adding enzyme
MPFEILSAEGRDAERWSALIAALPPDLRDIHFLPEYGRIYRDTYQQEPFLAVYEEGGDAILQPYVRRPLADLPFLESASDARQFADIANPYGYGGPLCTSPDRDTSQRLYSAFADKFADWCERQGIASEFTSLHPLFVGHQIGIIEPFQPLTPEKKVIVVDLQSQSGIWKDLRKGHRSSIKGAQREGVRVENVEPTVTNLEVFNELYHQTMTRREAASRWFFPDCYFSECVRHLGPRRTSLFFAYVGGDVESACLLMHDFAIAYYHFAATQARRPELGTNNCMVYETALCMHAAGYGLYHLGGGVGRDEEDGLFRFKAGFSPGRAPLYTYFRVRNSGIYDDLSARKRRFECATTGAELNSDFLPLYRR